MTATESEIDEIVRTVSANFGVEARDCRSERTPYADGLFGWVTVDGAWGGAIVVSCPRDVCQRMAAHFFGVSENAANDDQVRDALGELTNVVGGNIKSLLASRAEQACRLSLPVVSEFDRCFPGTRVVHRVEVAAGSGALRVTVLEASP